VGIVSLRFKIFPITIPSSTKIISPTIPQIRIVIRNFIKFGRRNCSTIGQYACDIGPVWSNIARKNGETSRVVGQEIPNHPNIVIRGKMKNCIKNELNWYKVELIINNF